MGALAGLQSGNMPPSTWWVAQEYPQCGIEGPASSPTNISATMAAKPYSQVGQGPANSLNSLNPVAVGGHIQPTLEEPLEHLALVSSEVCVTGPHWTPA